MAGERCAQGARRPPGGVAEGGAAFRPPWAGARVPAGADGLRTAESSKGGSLCGDDEDAGHGVRSDAEDNVNAERDADRKVLSAMEERVARLTEPLPPRRTDSTADAPLETLQGMIEELQMEVMGLRGRLDDQTELLAELKCALLDACDRCIHLRRPKSPTEPSKRTTGG